MTLDDLQRYDCSGKPVAFDSVDAVYVKAADLTIDMPVTCVSYQTRVRSWLTYCFGEEEASNKDNRRNRFGEEALELLQAAGLTFPQLIDLAAYVYGRPAGDPFQEIGGTVVTLSGLCEAYGISLRDAADAELKRVNQKIEAIRAKEAARPSGSVLPGGAHVTLPHHPYCNMCYPHADPSCNCADIIEDQVDYWRTRTMAAEAQLRNNVTTIEVLRKARRYDIWRVAIFEDVERLGEHIRNSHSPEELDANIDRYGRH